jgi:hypothetical protein
MADPESYKERMRRRQVRLPPARSNLLRGPFDLVLDLDQYCVTRGELPPVFFGGKRLAWGIFVALCGRNGGYCRPDELVAVWNPRDRREELEAIKHGVEEHVRLLRKVVRPLGVVIPRAVPDLGYRLAAEP